MNDIAKRLGQRIRDLRTQGGHYTQEALAERARISVSFLSMLERGERSAHLETLADIADALGVSLCDLFEGLDGKKPPSDDILRPLSEFVRVRQLGAKDVNKLLSVARTMFGDG